MDNKYYTFYNNDCLKILDQLIENNIKVDAIITDPPYGSVACNWDKIIPFKQMWTKLNKLLVKDGVIVLFGAEPFSTSLKASNLKMFKYDWIWEKNISTNFLHAKTQPLRKHELISVFYNKCGKYYPIKTTGHIPTQSAKKTSNGNIYYKNNKPEYIGGSTERFPTTILKFDVVDIKNRINATQKPVDLLEYLVKTYSKEGEVILDFTMGSFTTAIACLNTKRSFIGIELDKKCYQLGKERFLNHLKNFEKKPIINFNEEE